MVLVEWLERVAADEAADPPPKRVLPGGVTDQDIREARTALALRQQELGGRAPELADGLRRVAGLLDRLGRRDHALLPLLQEGQRCDGRV
jgi:hypothetical protein